MVGLKKDIACSAKKSIEKLKLIIELGSKESIKTTSDGNIIYKLIGYDGVERAKKTIENLMRPWGKDELQKVLKNIEELDKRLHVFLAKQIESRISTSLLKKAKMAKIDMHYGQ